MFQEYEVVKLKKDLPSSHLQAGARGTVLLVYLQPPGPSDYEVEFTDGEGNALAILTLSEADLEKA